MNILIVFAHPERQSLNGHLLDLAKTTLEDIGHRVKVSDLYEMNFKAVADKHDFIHLKDPFKFNLIKEQYYASLNNGYTEDIKQEQEKVSWADLILFQYPIWWTDPPAILKGWFDRVFTYNFAYGPGRYEQGNLKGKKAMLSITHGGEELDDYGFYGIKGEIEERLFSIQHEKLFYCGMDVLQPFIFHSSADENQRNDLLVHYKHLLLNVEKLPVVDFHPSTHYENGQLKKEYREPLKVTLN